MLYGLETCPLTVAQLAKLDVARSKMLRKIVGWRCQVEDSWEQIGQKMKQRVANALALQPVDVWSEVLVDRKSKLHVRLRANGAPLL